MTKRERGDLIYGVVASALVFVFMIIMIFSQMMVSLVGGYAAARQRHGAACLVAE
jgi:hypothetical protein